MFDRGTLLGNLAPGHIFHAEARNGASMICLVLSINETSIRARRVTSQEALEFDRRTGKTEVGEERIPCVINSVAPLPSEIHDVFLALDRKFGQITQKDWDEPDLARTKLTEAEKKALRFVGPYYASNPLPPPVS